MKESSPFSRLNKEVKKVLKESNSDSQVLEEVAAIIYEEVDYYDWVGFYLAKSEKDELILGPFIGDETEHTRIDYGEGICGQSAETGETFTVPNVEEEDNYLSCSPEVSSEIVVPVFQDGDFRGEIDIDSHELDPFGPEDERFLESLADDIAPFF